MPWLARRHVDEIGLGIAQDRNPILDVGDRLGQEGIVVRVQFRARPRLAFGYAATPKAPVAISARRRCASF